MWGANFWSSRCQFPTRLVGVTMRDGDLHAPGLFLPGEQGDRLERLAEPHVVGEHAAHAVIPEVLEPHEALVLVGP